MFFSPPKKVVLFPGIGQVKFFFYHLPACILVCLSEYFLFDEKDIHKHKQKAKETKEKKRISIENLTGYYDTVCESALCTFNLRDGIVNFFWLFI